MRSFVLDNSKVLVNTEITQFNLRSGIGCYRVELEVTLSPTRYTPRHGKLILRGGQVSLGRNMNASRNTYLGDLRITGDPVISLSGRRSVKAYLTLSPRQLNEIRRRTTGENVWISVDLQGYTHWSESEGSRGEYSESGTRVEGHAEIGYKISQSDWLRKLERAGFADVLLIEITTPPQDAPSDLEASVSKLKKAQSLFHQGDYEGAVAACRKALEALNKGLKVNPAETEKAYIDNRKGMTLTERKLLLRHILRHYTHPAHHADELSIDPRYTRHDAQLALTSTAAAVSEGLASANSADTEAA